MRPVEQNWLALYRAAVAAPGYPNNVENFSRYVENPGIRQHDFGATGQHFGVPLSALAAITIDLTDAEQDRVAAEELRVRRGRASVDLEIADGATVFTVKGRHRVALQAHRNLNSELVTVRLYWPRYRDLWKYFQAVMNGTRAQVEAALRGDF